MCTESKLKRWIYLWKNQFSINRINNNRCEDINSVLIIKLDAIGDFVIWLDSAKEYRGLYPDKKITLFCNALCKEVAEATGYFDEIIVLNIQRYETDENYRYEQNKVLEDKKYGLLIQTAYSRTQHMDMLAATIFAHKKIGFEADESKSNVSRRVISRKNKNRLDCIYDQLISASKENLMELQRNKEFIVGLGNKKFKSAIPELPHINDVMIPSKQYFVVFPGASTTKKMWRTDWYAEIIDYISGLVDWDCLVCGSKDEEYLFDFIQDNVVDKERVQNYCGKASLLELIEVVRNAQFVLSNDTGGIHYAAATRTKGVCPFGEYNYGRFLPYQCDIGISTIQICSANMKCKNCSKHRMSFSCIINLFKTGRYLCIDRVDMKNVKEGIDSLLGEIIHEPNNNNNGI